MKLYESIEEMPVYNWFKCIEHQAYEYCTLKPSKSDLSDLEFAECSNMFAKLYDQYMDKYGVSEQLKEVMSLNCQIAVHEIDMALTGDMSIETFIDIKKIELSKLMEAPAPKTNSAKVAIEKMLGFRLNLKDVTVTEYYDYIEELKTQNKAA